MTGSEPFVVLESVAKRWNGQLGVEDVSLSVPRGSFVALLGPSGCGKSTTLRLVSGLELVDEGRIIIDGRDVDTPVYHRTHSAYAVASFHEALRILLTRGVARQADDYAFCERALRQAVEALGCEVTSNMTSLVVLNLPGALAGREKELVGNCRARDFCIWPTLSEPVQVRIGILNQLNEAAVISIVDQFADAMIELGAEVDKNTVLSGLSECFGTRRAA